LDRSLLHLDRSAGQESSAITLLRELRTRLIADVVTGKLDVREAAARLPDDPEESDTEDEADTSDADEDDISIEDADEFLEEALS
jgi:type I restriction enzyme S subunit